MPPQDSDNPWKEAFDHHAELLLALLVPDVHADLDWARDVESLEQELRKLTPDAETGKRFADKLLKAWTKGDDERYIHVEIQAQPVGHFERRVHTYHYRIDDRFQTPPETVVILADDDPKWRPTKYVVEMKFVRQVFEFEPVKILDWQARMGELSEHANPAALFVLAHLESQRTRGNPEEQARVKLDLILRLQARKLDGEELRQWYRYLDWFLPLPKEHETQLWLQLKQIEMENKMPFITFAERYGLEQGERVGLLRALRLGLKLKFGDAGLVLMPDAERQENLDPLRAACDAIESAATIEDVKRLLP